MMSPMLYREIEKFGAAVQKARPGHSGQHTESFSRMGFEICEMCETLRNYACFAINP